MMIGGIQNKRILICNDDGINAIGIQILATVAKTFSNDVWVVAPAYEQSGTAHSFTLGKALHAEKVAHQTYTVTGTPTDCVLFAFNALLKDKRPDYVLSGINHGENLGLDVMYSGTAGAAIEGALQGAKSFAFSLSGAKKGSDFWSITEKRVRQILEHFSDFDGTDFLNVNLPATSDQAEVKITKLSNRKIGDAVEVESTENDMIDFKITSAHKKATILDHSDVEAINNNFVSITPINIDLTCSSLTNVAEQLITG